MAISGLELDDIPSEAGRIGIASFTIEGLFNRFNHRIVFPQAADGAAVPEILIIEGQNGIGKTTIMSMISGILGDLNFDAFRGIPFSRAQLELTNGDTIGVIDNKSDRMFPIIATFRHNAVNLARDREEASYSSSQMEEIQRFRSEAKPVINSLDFEYVPIERSLKTETKASDMEYDQRTGRFKHRQQRPHLAGKVHRFLREAQINYRRFFEAGELELLPRLIEQLNTSEKDHQPDDLLRRIYNIQDKNNELSRFGLATDDADLNTLSHFITSQSVDRGANTLALLAGYIESQESRGRARELIATRLSLFETIMDDFFVGKKVRISTKNGIDITNEDTRLSEHDLSSGEFHFLYMMVSALLCERSGTIIAIDEPELSLHTSWQRRLLNALSKCASGAAPTFYLSTHSTAISSAHRQSVQTLSPIE